MDSLAARALPRFAERLFAGRFAANRPVRRFGAPLPHLRQAAFGGRLRRSLTRLQIAGAWS